MLLRSGFIRPLAAGIFSELNLARRSIAKIEKIMREELDAIGGQEISMPVVHPAEIWQETDRWSQIGEEMGRFQDRSKRDMVLAMTHEEVVTDLLRREVHSYRQLPLLVYQIQTKWRDDPRPRAGLIRAREFTMLDSYSLDINEEGLDKQYNAHYQTYFKIFHRCGLSVIAVKSDVGMMGGKLAHEFIYLNPMGEDTILICENCGYKANGQVARISKSSPAEEEPLPLSKVATPGAHTIAHLAEFLQISKSKTAKAVFFMATIMEGDKSDERLVFAVLRGDMELNETKLANAVKAQTLRPATDDEILSIGAEPGYASPIGIEDVFAIVDDLIPLSPNLVAGANEEGYHFKNVNYDRDFVAEGIADLVLARSGDPCPVCTQAMISERGIEVGNIFKLGTRYSQAMGATFLDQDGEPNPVVMGSYGIGLGRLLACIAEQHHDEDGLIWPVSIAPYHVYLIGLPGEDGLAQQIYQELEAGSVEVLYDDRDERPGVKFKDADLIGLPLRLTIGKRSLEQGGVEWKFRHRDEAAITPVSGILEFVKSNLTAL
ncbi:MAG: proline--tRNA ligase [Chloroflexi bacterium RBG_16_48_8]|nr:MAG: proline--tRNA ligase [Chloroflexi bacterium RBG_16_48_8]